MPGYEERPENRIDTENGEGEPRAGARPSVLFVCVKNAGKSQMAAGLMAKRAGRSVEIHSAGTKPGTEINALSAEALSEIGVDITAEVPKGLDPELLARVDLVVVLGREAVVRVPESARVRTWDTDEPSERGIGGIERMRLVRDDIAERVDALAGELGHRPRPASWTSRTAAMADPSRTADES